MATKSLEELEKMVQRSLDHQEVQNLMGRYSHFHLAEDQQKTVELWSKRPDCGIEIAWGVYEGADAAERCYLVDHDGYNKVGAMHCHTLTSPIVEVAGDGKTAKGVWISPGFESDFSQGGDKPRADWAWLKYAADFVKENGKWKFWHLRVYGLFLCPYDKPWTEVGIPVFEDFKDSKVDRPRSADPDECMYSLTRGPKLLPVPPEPYETWDESTSYVKTE